MYQRYPVPWLCRGCAVAVPPRTGEPEPGTICRQSSLRVTTGGICSAQPHRQVWWSPSARRIPNMESEGPGRFQVNELYYLENTWKYLADITIKHDCIQFLSSACIYIYVCVLYIYIDFISWNRNWSRHWNHQHPAVALVTRATLLCFGSITKWKKLDHDWLKGQEAKLSVIVDLYIYITYNGL